MTNFGCCGIMKGDKLKKCNVKTVANKRNTQNKICHGLKPSCQYVILPKVLQELYGIIHSNLQFHTCPRGDQFLWGG